MSLAWRPRPTGTRFATARIALVPAVRRAAAWSLGSAGVALGLGGLRLAPAALAPGVPGPALARLVAALGLGALEAGLLVGIPVGAALAGVALVERRAIRALAVLGVPPRRLLAGLAVGLLPFAAVLFAVSYAATAAREPARLGAGLVGDAERACRTGIPRPAVAAVPGLPVAFVCAGTSDDAGARVVLASTVGARRAVGTARSLVFRDGEARLEAARFRVEGPPPVAIEAATLRVRLAADPFGGGGLPPGRRAVLLAATAWAAALLSFGSVVRGPRSSPVLAFVAAALPGASLLALLPALERGVPSTGLRAGLAVLASFLAVGAGMGVVAYVTRRTPGTAVRSSALPANTAGGTATKTEAERAEPIS